MKVDWNCNVNSLVMLCACLLGIGQDARAAGVTLITHGFSSSVDAWIVPMADRMVDYSTFPGTNSSCYQISITRNAQGQYVASQTFLGGVSPLMSNSGEILIKLDWSTLSSFGGAGTATIANTAAAALLATNFIPELNGRALAELPLHLIGHSRGASVVTELARFLGAQGVWVDHVTMLDPRPVSLLGDPAMKNYANILFADNYWQNLGDGLTVPNGQPIAGAYNRQLTSLSGGYSSSHSDVHLWYHGTIDLATPTTDTQANLTAAERQSWWTDFEAAGAVAGFYYSLIGGGDRLSNDEPASPGNGRIRDGFNKVWDLGAGISPNRDALPSNNGDWPNLIRLNITSTNAAPIGEPISLAFYYQFGSSTGVLAEIRFYADADANPYDGNEFEIHQATVPGTGTNSVFFSPVTLLFDATNTPPGTYAVFARLSDGARRRYLYAAEPLTLYPSLLPPTLTALGMINGQFHLQINGFPGQKIAVEASTNLAADWTVLVTNTLTGASLTFTDPASTVIARRYYRAVLLP